MKTNPSASGGQFRADGRPRAERPRRLRVAFWVLLALAAFYLLTEHRAHLALGLPYLPLLLLGICPLMHLFGHGGHGGHGEMSQRPPSGAHGSPQSDAESDPTESKADLTGRHGGNLS